jgi:RNA polymerase sigma-70 factor (ECF subfamily)
MNKENPTDRADIPDVELVERASSGDKLAFGVLYERYLEKIYRYVFYRVGEHVDTEDLTETVFLKAWESLPQQGQQNPVQNFQAWIYRIAHNTIIDFYRTRKPYTYLDSITPVDDPAPAPERVIQSHQENQRLAQAISRLKPSAQQVIACRFISQLSHAETAEIMGLTEGHVRVLQHRALKQLRKILKEDHR